MTAGLMRRLGAIRALGQRREGDARRIVLAQWELLRARLSLVFTPRGRLLRPLAAPQVSLDDDRRARAARIAWAVEWASANGVFHPTCLVRAIALERLLRRDGIPGAAVRIGARRRGAQIEMHAWIELGGMSIGTAPEPDVGAFTPLRDFTLVRGA